MAAYRIDETPEWAALAEHLRTVERTNLRELFDTDPSRGRDLTAEAGDLYLDYSKNRLTPETMTMLAALARRAGVEQFRDAMFAGEKINVTEQRAATLR